MRKFIDDMIRDVHWPSWLRGIGVGFAAFGLAELNPITGIIGILLYIAGFCLRRHFPYIWISAKSPPHQPG